MAILLAIGAPKLMDMRSSRLRRAANELAANIKLLRNLAIATQRHTWIVFNVGRDSYSAYIERPSSPGRANRIPVTHPVQGGNFTVTLNSGEFTGVTIQNVSLGPGSEIEFDWSGTPLNGNGVALAADGTVVLAGSGRRTVRIIRETGFVQED